MTKKKYLFSVLSQLHCSVKHVNPLNAVEGYYERQSFIIIMYHETTFYTLYC
uniref:Uncharacterized protein n=1 Tax=Papilio xuthus TaxID=66420 RepID=I4DQN7_PAPXU|nr:unknown unsecreted protein [Papilio xuthus]